MAAIIMIGCGDTNLSASSKDGGETGSVTFNVVWQGGPDDGQKNHARALPGNCPVNATVEATIFTEDMTAYKPFFCFYV